ncbi:Hypothetical predicted protein [Mytilus galloprovincialis]|uniref:Uncharacterized protein n=1 Tax=Mytilus galloprovincialis TaxID=29158 RepID=A0A8B6FVG5_MYTGA|nr:Hypothetical predicted protein [Mytilus galloprovincialis]
MSFRSLKTDIDPRKLIRRWKSMPRQQRTTVTESDVTYRDSTGRTLLYFAAKNGETERVKQLLKAGCNPRLSDINRNTALHMAADGGYIEIIHMLVEYGCKLNARNILGQTALMKAVQYDDLETVSVLYNAGAYLDLTDCTGKTALLLALQDGNEEISSFLLRNGTDVNVVDYIGQSALYTVVNSNEKLPLSLCRKVVDAGYNFEHDTEWITKDLHRQLTQPQVGLVTRIKRRLSLKRNPERQHEDSSTTVSNDKKEVSNDKRELLNDKREVSNDIEEVSNDVQEASNDKKAVKATSL